MNRPSHYDTKGRQAILFGNASIGGILLITLLFLLNAALILCIDSFLIHNIPGDETGRPILEDRIPGDILSTRSMNRGYLILYRTEDGQTKVAKATENMFYRYRLEPNIASITEEPYQQNGAMLDFTVDNGKIISAANISLLNSRYEMGALIALCFLVTALERMLFEKLRGN